MRVLKFPVGTGKNHIRYVTVKIPGGDRRMTRGPSDCYRSRTIQIEARTRSCVFEVRGEQDLLPLLRRKIGEK